MYPTLTPAYGRDYTTAKAAREAFLGGADFVLHSYQGTTYVNVDDLRAAPAFVEAEAGVLPHRDPFLSVEYGAVNIRYAKNRKVCVVRIPGAE